MVQFLDSRATLGRFVVGEGSIESVLRHGGRAAVILDDALEVSLSECVTPKTAVAQVRARLALSRPPSTATPTIFDPITARHGSKHFSELFELYRKDRDWSVSTAKRNETEAELFAGLMGNPALGDIEKETVLEFARLLALLPRDIYRSRKRGSLKLSLHDRRDQDPQRADRACRARRAETQERGYGETPRRTP